MKEDEELDYKVATDKESLRIRRLMSELKSVSSIEDKKLFVWIGFSLFSILIYIVKPNFITQILVLIFVPVSVIGGIGSTLYNNIRKKKNIIIKHGLQCRNCGFIPSTLNAPGVLGGKKCLKCHTKLNI